MFLYLLDEKEGIAFMELALQAMKINGGSKECVTAEYEAYLTELNLIDYNPGELTLEQAVDRFRKSTTQVKRSDIIELSSMLYADKEIDSKEMRWIYCLSDEFKMDRTETERLVMWSKDFCDFMAVGLMYINAKS